MERIPNPDSIGESSEEVVVVEELKRNEEVEKRLTAIRARFEPKIRELQDVIRAAEDAELSSSIQRMPLAEQNRLLVAMRNLAGDIGDMNQALIEEVIGSVELDHDQKVHYIRPLYTNVLSTLETLRLKAQRRVQEHSMVKKADFIKLASDIALRHSQFKVEDGLRRLGGKNFH